MQRVSQEGNKRIFKQWYGWVLGRLYKIEYTINLRKKISRLLLFLLSFSFQLRYQIRLFFFISFFLFFVAHVTVSLHNIVYISQYRKMKIDGSLLHLFILLCAQNDMVLSSLVYIALVIIVIIVIVVSLRFLFNTLFVMPVTLEHEYLVKYATSIYLPT